MIIEIARHTPPWVWLLLLALLALGAVQLRPRQISRAQLLALPLAMVGLGLSSLAGPLRATPWAAAAWALGLALAAIPAARWLVPAAARWDAAIGRLHIEGSAWPLALMVLVFGFKYGVGVFSAIAPASAARPGVALMLALASGAISGLFLGRAWAALALTMPRHVRAT